MTVAVLFMIASNGKEPKCSSTSEWLNNLNLYNKILLSSKMKALLIR